MANPKPRPSVGKSSVAAIVDGGHALIKPPPVGAHRDAPSPSPAVQLALLLSRIRNDRAYTVLGHEGNVWTIHFEGDPSPSVLTFEGEKP